MKILNKTITPKYTFLQYSQSILFYKDVIDSLINNLATHQNLGAENAAYVRRIIHLVKNYNKFILNLTEKGFLNKETIYNYLLYFSNNYINLESPFMLNLLKFTEIIETYEHILKEQSLKYIKIVLRYANLGFYVSI